MELLRNQLFGWFSLLLLLFVCCKLYFAISSSNLEPFIINNEDRYGMKWRILFWNTTHTHSTEQILIDRPLFSQVLVTINQISFLKKGVEIGIGIAIRGRWMNGWMVESSSIFILFISNGFLVEIFQFFFWLKINHCRTKSSKLKWKNKQKNRLTLMHGTGVCVCMCIRVWLLDWPLGEYYHKY